MKDLLCIHLNEFNRKYLIDKGKKYNKKNILSFFNKFENYIETYSVDKIQDKNLDPWVQSVTINTGKTSSNHKIYKIGQGVPKKTMQIWDILTKKKIKSGVWGTMNSILKKNKYLNFYYPDPWNYNSKTYPQNLESFLNLSRYYAQNYTSYNKLTILRYRLFFLDSESTQSGYLFLHCCICLIFLLAIFLMAFIRIGLSSVSFSHLSLSLI